MKGYILSAVAEQDLDEIFEYTLENFGFKQAQQYLLDFHELFVKLTQNPTAGRPKPEIRKQLRSIVKESHVVFYRVDGHSVLIIRVLHASRDLPRQF